MSISKALLVAAGILFGVLVVVAMVLGYSGNARLAGIGNALLFTGLLLALPLAVAGLIVRVVERGRRT